MLKPHSVLTALLATALLLPTAASADTTQPQCSATGTPPLQTVAPVSERPKCKNGQVLSFEQAGITRYACLNLPPHAAGSQGQWPLLVYLHGSMTTPDSLYHAGRNLLALSQDYPLSRDGTTRGFIILSPEGRRAKAWPSDGPHTGTGYHWDEWQRDPEKNLDVQAIDHFVEQVSAGGQVDPKQIYVFGWSNGAFMAVLYGSWRQDKIAAVGQYAGADPWSRTPCPVSMPTEGRQVPLTLLRNLCDALATCQQTGSWSATLTKLNWPSQRYDLAFSGKLAEAGASCAQSCGKAHGLYEHIRWPQKTVLADGLLGFFKQHPLP
jgi:poly(3-hydroxybutyrate) depolymerase